MFEQHPVPQQISSYQFRLVGDMTLKQFFQLAAGAVLGLLIYATPLPAIFKWPLIILLVAAGAAFAFLPLYDRPLEEWVSAFFRAIYGPTIFKWSKEANVMYFAPDASAATPTGDTANQVTTNESVSNLEKMEKNFLANITGMFSLHPKTSTPTTQAAETQAVPTPPVPEQKETIQPGTSAAVTPEFQLHGARVLTANEVITKEQPRTVIEHPAVATPQAGHGVTSTPITSAVGVMQKSGASVFVAPNATPQGGNLTTNAVTPTLPNGQPGMVTTQAQFSDEAAPPTPASMPNVIVGQVLSEAGSIVEGAILEVKDFQGRPVRAFKTNRLGHFTIVTPLPNGTYTIVVEKEGHVFEPITFDAHGTLIPPIAIKAKS